MSECPLTLRERRILSALGNNTQLWEVEETLERSGADPTVLFDQICTKLQVGTIVAAAMWAASKGWIPVLQLQSEVRPNPLSAREKQALTHFHQGQAIEEIARSMATTYSAVQNLLRYAREKVGVNTSKDAAQLAYEWGWLDD